MKTSILPLDKKLARQTKEILFLKITATTTPTDGSGLQPSVMILHDAPGTLPQAGMTAGLWPSVDRGIRIPLPPLAEQRRIVADLDAEAMQMEAVRSLVPRFEAKIQRVLDRMWGNGTEAGPA